MRSNEWSSGPVVVAVSRTQRRFGMRPVPGPFDLLLRTRSVHSFGMRVALGWVALDGRGRVVGSGTMPPRRVIVVPRARFVLEQRALRSLPTLGEPTTLRLTRDA